MIIAFRKVPMPFLGERLQTRERWLIATHFKPQSSLPANKLRLGELLKRALKPSDFPATK